MGQNDGSTVMGYRNGDMTNNPMTLWDFVMGQGMGDEILDFSDGNKELEREWDRDRKG